MRDISRDDPTMPRGIAGGRGPSGEDGVDDGTRTHDSRDHNPGLYQLSYVHRRNAPPACLPVAPRGRSDRRDWRARQDSNLRPSA